MPLNTQIPFVTIYAPPGRVTEITRIWKEKNTVSDIEFSVIPYSEPHAELRNATGHTNLKGLVIEKLLDELVEAGKVEVHDGQE